MRHLRGAIAVVVGGFGLLVLGASTASASPADSADARCEPPVLVCQVYPGPPAPPVVIPPAPPTPMPPWWCNQIVAYPNSGSSGTSTTNNTTNTTTTNDQNQGLLEGLLNGLGL
jgi:hypothetical protein